jgi:CRISPR-associated protein Cmr3
MLQPRDTLLVRDAKPGSGAGALRSLDFPWPSSLAGLVRTRAGTDLHGYFDPQFAESAKQIALRGPLLVALKRSGDIDELFVPTPSDCVWYSVSEGNKQEYVGRPLVPRDPRKEISGCLTDLADKWSGNSRTFYLLGHVDDIPVQKPVAGSTFWRWEDFEKWLFRKESAHQGPLDKAAFESFGIRSLIREQRTHVSIQPGSQTAADGMLFTTESLRFTKMHKGSAPRELGLLFSCDNPYQAKSPLNEGMVTFGGERKLSFLSKSNQTLPATPQQLTDALKKSREGGPRLARVILLTPALFKDGFAPKWIGHESVPVVAAAVQRPQIVSGWDFQLVKASDGSLRQKGPKPNRRMAPAGSVYWVELPNGLNIAEWLDSVWMKCLQNQMTPQESRDGFGLCVVGVG